MRHLLSVALIGLTACAPTATQTRQRIMTLTNCYITEFGLHEDGWAIRVSFSRVPKPDENWAARTEWTFDPLNGSQATIYYYLDYLRQNPDAIRAIVAHELAHLAVADITAWVYDAAGDRPATRQAVERVAWRIAGWNAILKAC